MGTQRSDVLKLILKLILGQGLILATAGMAGGLVAALIVTRFAAHLARYFPARRATRIDPMTDRGSDRIIVVSLAIHHPCHWFRIEWN